MNPSAEAADTCGKNCGEDLAEAVGVTRVRVPCVVTVVIVCSRVGNRANHRANCETLEARWATYP